ncbi:hypothetical protein MIND_00188300 [Mycena indigotica]|uniref:Uncharacterized protein n=1 Tax=Mycena indigotica TaxID=2126181 RepID=A0A8H6WEE8_9AGAR|nr:uncharacterized protein MIND_00188300 [Mycena indigotica]KAF7311778.1 hypothetical protein MIND_00188300 [Mycena indigotica]
MLTWAAPPLVARRACPCPRHRLPRRAVVALGAFARCLRAARARLAPRAEDGKTSDGATLDDPLGSPLPDYRTRPMQIPAFASDRLHRPRDERTLETVERLSSRYYKQGYGRAFNYGSVHRSWYAGTMPRINISVGSFFPPVFQPLLPNSVALSSAFLHLCSPPQTELMYALTTCVLLALGLAASAEIQIAASANPNCEKPTVFQYRDPGSQVECVNLGGAMRSIQWNGLETEADLFVGNDCSGQSAPLGGNSGCATGANGATWSSIRLHVSNPNPGLPEIDLPEPPF